MLNAFFFIGFVVLLIYWITSQDEIKRLKEKENQRNYKKNFENINDIIARNKIIEQNKIIEAKEKAKKEEREKGVKKITKKNNPA